MRIKKRISPKENSIPNTVNEVEINKKINGTDIGEAPFLYSGWKESGLEVELSHHGLEEYLNIKHIRIDIEK